MMKKSIFLFFILVMSVGCTASNVGELREMGNIHNVYYANDSLQNVYNRAIKRYNECGISVSNAFIDSSSGEAGISLIHQHEFFKQYLWWIAQTDIKEEKENKVKIDVYGANTLDHIVRFVTIMQYIAENKDGCPQ